jgi:lipopolysaccharide/colanic/teichoic acid biosynthesis glycosyltransferase
MSFVGPRPEVPQLFARYPLEAQQLLASVRPGLTDCATLSGIDGLLDSDGEAGSLEERYLEIVVPRKVAMASACISERSLGHYCLDIWRTVRWILGASARVGSGRA